MFDNLIIQLVKIRWFLINQVIDHIPQMSFLHFSYSSRQFWNNRMRGHRTGKNVEPGRST